MNLIMVTFNNIEISVYILGDLLVFICIQHNMIEVLGPDNNWLIDNRFYEDAFQDTSNLLIPYTQDGNYVSIITGDPIFPKVKDVVHFLLNGGCQNTSAGHFSSTQVKCQEIIVLKLY